MTDAVGYPVIGLLLPYRPDLGAGFEQFVTPTMRGLARVTGRRLDLLAMDAPTPGRGDGGRFLAACQAAYTTVAVWELVNPQLTAMLARRGFWPVWEWLGGGASRGMRWDATP